MSPQRPNDAEAEVSRALWQASHGYGDLPEEVGDRLDRVLDSLPPVGTLHGSERAPAAETWTERWAERLRPKRVRYAIASVAAAVLVTVGGVATAVQLTTGNTAADSGSAQVFAEGEPERDAGDEAPGATEASPNGDETGGTQDEAGEDAEVGGLAGIETFATGTDYGAGTDLVAVLRELGSESTAGEVPPELAALAEGGDFWRNCQEAIAERYEGLLVAVDFARYDSEPAIMALMVGESGDIAVALTPACADGIIEPLVEQP